MDAVDLSGDVPDDAQRPFLLEFLREGDGVLFRRASNLRRRDDDRGCNAEMTKNLNITRIETKR